MYKKLSKQVILILLIAAFLMVPAFVVQLSYAQLNKDMQDVLDVHNRERIAVGYQPLTWSNSLAAESQKWADHLSTLGIVCGEKGCKPLPPHGANNENIAVGLVFPAEFGRTSPAEYAQMWADEKVLYNGGQRTGIGIGHYTAMVWKSTREVGCGFFAGPVPDDNFQGGGNNFLVCRYNPGKGGASDAPSNLPNY
jgi:pathogenesis-related protein 1